MGLWSPWFEGDQVILNEIICLNQHLYQRLIDLIADFWKCSSQHSARNLTGKAPLNFQPANSLMYPFVRNPQNQVRFHVIWQLWGRLFRCVFMLHARACLRGARKWVPVGLGARGQAKMPYLSQRLSDARNDQRGLHWEKRHAVCWKLPWDWRPAGLAELDFKDNISKMILSLETKTSKGFPRKSGPCVGTKFKVIDVNDSVVVIWSLECVHCHCNDIMLVQVFRHSSTRGLAKAPKSARA